MYVIAAEFFILLSVCYMCLLVCFFQENDEQMRNLVNDLKDICSVVKDGMYPFSLVLWQAFSEKACERDHTPHTHSPIEGLKVEVCY